MSVLWVTSFNEKLYETSGKHLVKSFQDQNIYGHLFIGSETGYLPECIVETDELINIDSKNDIARINNLICKYSLEDTELAVDWWLENQDIIPAEQGGLMTPCKCPDPWARSDSKHNPGCYHSWFNRNTYRFVNKIFTLHAALQLVNIHIYDYIIWVDCDCVFTKQITSDIIEEVIFDDCKADLAILRGPRKFLEAGLVGYNLTKLEGHDLLGIYIDSYRKRKFRNYPIWDDCHMLEQTLKIYHQARVHDLATTMKGHSDVFEDSLIGNYISHDKGRHGRKLGIFK